MTWLDWLRPGRTPVVYRPRNGPKKVAVIDLGRDVSRRLRRHIDEAIVTRGTPFETGGVLGPGWFLLLGAGSATASSLFAGNVFLATADTDTLMRIGAGVGSQVVDAAGKIAGQAPFVAASGAILPAVAPVLLFTALSAMAICARLDRLQISLDRIEVLVRQLLAQELAEDSGLLLSAMERVQDISDEFDECRWFTEEMKIRLALAERDLNVLHHKYEILSLLQADNQTAAELGVVRARLFAMASIADIRVDRLRFKLALQDNPGDLTRRVSALDKKIELYEESFRYLAEENPLDKHLHVLQKAADGMGFFMKNIFARKKFNKTKAEIAAITEKVRQIQEILSSPVDSESCHGSERQHLLVYYRERRGKGDLKAYYTADWKLVAHEAT